MKKKKKKRKKKKRTWGDMIVIFTATVDVSPPACKKVSCRSPPASKLCLQMPGTL
jgi:hypothetical protein